MLIDSICDFIRKHPLITDAHPEKSGAKMATVCFKLEFGDPHTIGQTDCHGQMDVWTDGHDQEHYLPALRWIKMDCNSGQSLEKLPFINCVNGIHGTVG